MMTATRPLRLCLVTANFWPAWGGAEGQCRLLARELRRRGHEVTVLTRGRSGWPAEEWLDGVRVRRISTPGSGHWHSALWTLAAAGWLRTRGRGFEILQAYQMLSPAHAALLGRRSRRQPVVVRPACSGIDGDVGEVRRLPLTEVRLRLLRRSSAFVTLSAAIEAELADLGVGAVPCRRIRNGVDTDVFRPAEAAERSALRTALGLPPDRVLCLFAGRLVPQKRPELLLDVWRDFRPSGAHLVLVGDGPMRQALAARVAADGLETRVTLAGATREAAGYLRAADLFVLPSRAEGMPNALLEAMACGLPAVATDVPGSRDVLGEDGDAGRLVPVGDPAALAEAVGRLAGDPGLRRALGGRARAIVQERHDLRRTVDHYLALYGELLA